MQRSSSNYFAAYYRCPIRSSYGIHRGTFIQTDTITTRNLINIIYRACSILIYTVRTKVQLEMIAPLFSIANTLRLYSGGLIRRTRKYKSFTRSEIIITVFTINYSHIFI